MLTSDGRFAEKAAAVGVPVLGAIGGATINVMFVVHVRLPGSHRGAARFGGSAPCTRGGGWGMVGVVPVVTGGPTEAVSRA